jgi:hypothetical protein
MGLQRIKNLKWSDGIHSYCFAQKAQFLAKSQIILLYLDDEDIKYMGT